MTYQQTIFGEELELTDQQSSAEDFPASRFPWLESKKAKGTTVISGRKCSELSESLRRVGSSVRTYLESCGLPLTTFVRTWSVRATKSGYLILKLRLSERCTGGSESPSWRPGNQGMWKTPVTADAANREFYVNSRGEPNLSAQVKLFPTPTATLGTNGGPNQRGTGNFQQLQKLRDAGAITETERRNMSQGNGGQLNPTWVEWLMGFPTGWTDLNA